METRNRLNISMESRIHGDVYVRFGGEHIETYRSKGRQGAMCLACGGGKTLIMCVSSFEKKRLGLVNKPIITALKANVHEIAQTYCTAYPNAKILYPGKEDFTPAKRMRIFNEMKNNNWDAIILTHEQFGMIPQSPEIQQQILQAELDSVEENLEVLRAQGKEISRGMEKGLVKRQLNLTAKLENITYQIENRKDDTVDFRLMGIDHLYVDESHYPNLNKIRTFPCNSLINSHDISCQF